MTTPKRQTTLVIGLILFLIVFDQAVKLLIHRYFAVGESIQVLPFFYLCHVENDGMAFGIEWFDKIFLTIFRVLAVGLLGFYLHQLLHPKENQPHVSTGFLLWIAAITAGALGNIIDCVFYGKLFGYARWGYGKVIDMLYFPLITNSEGECLFFQPVFNIADSCITIAVLALLIGYRKELDQTLSKKTDSPTTVQ